MAVPVEAVADEPPPVGSSDSVEDTRVPGPETDMSQSTSLNELPPELLWSILGQLPSTASTAQLLCGVCKEWRDAILHEDKYLNNLQFTLDTNQPFRGLGNVKGAVAHRRTWEHKRRDEVEELMSKASPFSRNKKSHHLSPAVPTLLEKASQTGKNVSALECLGTLRETQGDHGKAHKAWKRAAMLGSSTGQFKLGEIFYRGLGNHGVDGEEALFWLNKAVKNIAVPLDSDSLATAAGIMGFLHLDGEGTQACNSNAVKWFRVASSNGNKEASKTLGWLYNTGQY